MRDWMWRDDSLRTPDGLGGGGGLKPEPAPSKIQAFESKMGVKRHEDSWNRSPNVTNAGAIHVRTFHCKMSDDALGFLDQQINEWLDAHPQYEVKFSTVTVGDFQGKMGREVHMIVQVWV
jgi:hypothetical protein